MGRSGFIWAASIIISHIATSSLADRREEAVSFGTFGRPGHIDMPSGFAAPDATLGFSYTYSPGFTRNALFFQFAPWGGLTLRYGGNGAANASGIRPNYDRSLDLALTPLREGAYLPEISIGLQDFLGTGQYTGEYLAASKAFLGGKLVATAGLGWGRLASRGGFSNPLAPLSDSFKLRPRIDFGRGGKPTYSQWFRGDAAFFGGVTYAATPRLRLTAEYSTDDYTHRVWNGTLSASSAMNYGLSYSVNSSLTAQVGYLQGEDIFFGLTFRDNISRSQSPGSREFAPSSVLPRGGSTPAGAAPPSQVEEELRAIFDEVGLRLIAAKVEGAALEVSVENLAYDFEAQAVGRAARWMTHVAPPEIDIFAITLVVAGMPTSTITIHRDVLERQEHEIYGAEAIRMSSGLEAAAARGRDGLLAVAPPGPLNWGVGPYAQVTLFDPDQPRQADVGLEATARLTFGEGLAASATLRQRLMGNRSGGRKSNSVLPHVRTDQVLYDQVDGVKLENLYLSAYQRLAPDVYSRASIGLFEQMYAGVSAEVLWKPFAAGWSIGAEINKVVQRDYAGGFGFRDYRVTTGHVSAQYVLNNGYFGRIDYGRYLAGDVGATLTAGRQFANGWRLSAYATLTDVPFEDFGEGSFDKGIRIEIPTAQLLGTATRHKYDIGINSINRDGGRRLTVPGRLSDVLDGYSRREIDQSWSRLLR